MTRAPTRPGHHPFAGMVSAYPAVSMVSTGGLGLELADLGP